MAHGDEAEENSEAPREESQEEFSDQATGHENTSDIPPEDQEPKKQRSSAQFPPGTHVRLQFDKHPPPPLSQEEIALYDTSDFNGEDDENYTDDPNTARNRIRRSR